MCIRDRYQRRVHGIINNQIRVEKIQEMMKQVLSLAFLFILILQINSFNRKTIIDRNLIPVRDDSNDQVHADLPTNYDWRNIEGKNLVTLIKNQHIPQYCGACWTFGTTSALSDRIKIMRKAAFPDINLSPQVLLSCLTSDDKEVCSEPEACNGCKGGDPITVYQYINKKGLTDETCSLYQGWGHSNGIKCSHLRPNEKTAVDMRCYNYWGFNQAVENIPNPTTYKLDKFYRVTQELPSSPTKEQIEKNEQLMMNEIKANGPISCGIYADQLLSAFTGSKVFINPSTSTALNHEISIIGWGVEGNTKYWLVRNSWGTYWGDQGFAKIVRGVNNIGIESDCTAGIVKDTWTNAKHEPKLQTNSQNIRKPYMNSEFIKQDIPDLLPAENSIEEENASYPDNWFWGDVNGVNYLSWTVNQHIPTYCGSCWAQGSVAAMADRFNILQKNQFPQVNLAVQVIVNCRAGGSCHGGDHIGVYKFFHDKGVPDTSCQQYTALDPKKFDCSAIQTCETCVPPVPDYSQGIGAGNCSAVTNFQRYYAKSYARVSGADKMKAEIYKNGPISCGIEATDTFAHKYTWGTHKDNIYSERTSGWINHIIAVVGWGKTADGKEYWIGRNSWGTQWGLDGFFRLPIGGDNLSIEDECAYGCLLYTSPSPRDVEESRMPSSA
eukprot:TRINITY_DN261_c0_g1_i14.p1 TRINITY_DN261_c0_g1~~TRINITY_DN261_c0_g1_i14.p1  ORF type:complete len:711 (-),score=357.79 TRINITY_DN261_c0_g1_i14:19-2013(-)